MIEYHAKSSNRAVKDDKLLTYDSITIYINTLFQVLRSIIRYSIKKISQVIEGLVIF